MTTNNSKNFLKTINANYADCSYSLDEFEAVNAEDLKDLLKLGLIDEDLISPHLHIIERRVFIPFGLSLKDFPEKYQHAKSMLKPSK